MSDWITNRLPLESDANESHDVLIPFKDGSTVANWDTVEENQPWHPLPKAYVPPKPKRRAWIDVPKKGLPTRWERFVETDPADLDDFLEKFDYWVSAGPYGGPAIAWRKLLEARKPKS